VDVTVSSSYESTPSTTGTALRWSLGRDVRLAYSTAADGDQRQASRREAWLAGMGLSGSGVVPAQIHGAVVVDAGDVAGLAGADGVVGPRVPGRVIGVFGADCPGLCLAAPDALGVAHCGWRGTATGIVAALVAGLRRHSPHDPATWQAFIGPGIAGDLYEVDAPVLGARIWPAEAVTPTHHPGRALLDLPLAIAADCRAAGITRIAGAAERTGRDPRLHSYRRNGPGLVQMLAAWVPGDV
jgi:copper oxidase (laccase) domain-containing protein